MLTRPIIVELYFDADSTTRTRSLWEHLRNLGVSSSVFDQPQAPHVSLGGTNAGLDVDAFGQTLDGFARRTAGFPLTLSHLGVFSRPQAVLFLGVTVTRTLLNLHADFHDGLLRHTAQPTPYYVPGVWIPHCTLAFGLPDDALSRALAVCMPFPLPLQVRVERIGMVDTETREVLYSAPLVGK